MRHVFQIIISLFLSLSCSTYCFSKCGYITVTAGGKIFYEEQGKGEPLILLHGHSLDHRMWNLQFDEFARYYRTIRLDFRGYGRSSEQPESFQFCHVDDLITLMDSLNISRAHVVGLSMGAFIAGDLLAMYPERLLCCTLASGSIRGSLGPSMPMDTKEHAKREKEIEQLLAKGVDNMKKEWLETLVKGGGSKRNTMRKPLQRMIEDWTAWQPLNKEARLYYGKDAWKMLEERQPDVPVLMLRGKLEGKGKKTREERFLKNFRLKELPDCGHMMNMERPDLFNHAVLDFLQSMQKHQ